MHCTDLWIIEHMVEASARSAEVGAVLDHLHQDVSYTIFHESRPSDDVG